MKVILSLFFLCFLCTDALWGDSLNRGSLRSHVDTLSSESYLGRGVSNFGAIKAAGYIKRQFFNYGLFPFFEDSYSQSFLWVLDSSDDNGIPFVSLQSVEGFSYNEMGSNDLSECQYYGLQENGEDSFWLKDVHNVDSIIGRIDYWDHLRRFRLVYELSLNRFNINSNSDLDYLFVASSRLGLDMSKIFIGDEYANDYQKTEKDFLYACFNDDKEFYLCENLGGFFPAGNDTDSTVFITAHYDHLGGDANLFYPGANDNASGVAVLLDVAKGLSKIYEEGWRPGVNIAFVAFTAEEKGLIGSGYFVRHSPVDLSQVKLVFNLDMIGGLARLLSDNPENMYFIGCDRISPSLEREFESLVISEPDLDFNFSGRSSYLKYSDQARFIDIGVPSVFLFGGICEHYHQPSDVAEHLQYDRMMALRNVLIEWLSGL